MTCRQYCRLRMLAYCLQIFWHVGTALSSSRAQCACMYTRLQIPPKTEPYGWIQLVSAVAAAPKCVIHKSHWPKVGLHVGMHPRIAGTFSSDFADSAHMCAHQCGAPKAFKAAKSLTGQQLSSNSLRSQHQMLCWPWVRAMRISAESVS